MNENNKETSPDTTDAKQDELQSRRAVLRGALMVGCSLLAPAIFSSSANGAEEPGAVKKMSKKSVMYQLHPKGEQKCSTCMNFVAVSHTCLRVEGPIDPNGWCILWAKKT